MSSFLLPFQKTLGFDLKYRSGYTFGGLEKGDFQTVPTNIDRHQWVEVTYRPSMQTDVVDLFYEGGNRMDQKFLKYPIASAYSETMYPNGILPTSMRKGTKVKPTVMSDFE